MPRPKDKPRMTVNPSDEFRQIVELHKQKQGFKSDAQALLDLARIGAERQGYKLEAPMNGWGGKRE